MQTDFKTSYSPWSNGIIDTHYAKTDEILVTSQAKEEPRTAILYPAKETYLDAVMNKKEAYQILQKWRTGYYHLYWPIWSHFVRQQMENEHSYSPWSNGIIERLNVDIIALLKAVLTEMSLGLHKVFAVFSWAE